MTELEKILARMEAAVKEKQQNHAEVQQNNPVVAAEDNSTKPHQQGKVAPVETMKPPIRGDMQAGIQLCALVAQSFDSLNVYGKTTDQLENIAGAFQLVFGDYDIDTVRKAFTKYLVRGTVMPTPADIMNIIDPLPPKLSGAVYVALKKQIVDNIFITPKEREYMAAYEKQELDKVRGGSDELREAQKQIEEYRLKLGVDDE